MNFKPSHFVNMTTGLNRDGNLAYIDFVFLNNNTKLFLYVFLIPIQKELLVARSRCILAVDQFIIPSQMNNSKSISTLEIGISLQLSLLDVWSYKFVENWST